jgi:quercetin dioxygenase-like cupin family protein
LAQSVAAEKPTLVVRSGRRRLVSGGSTLLFVQEVAPLECQKERAAMIKLPFAMVTTAILLFPFAASAQEVPDALSVEWQGNRLCEKLHEDDQTRILRCTFPPGAKHVRHQHPASFVYALSGGKFQVENAGGIRDAELPTDAYVLNKPVPWHEVTNAGDTTERFLVIEMKYQTR